MPINRISIASSLASVRQNAILLPFYKDGEPLTEAAYPRWGMSLRAAGSMRFRWNEQNPRRERFLRKLCADPLSACAALGSTADGTVCGVNAKHTVGELRPHSEKERTPVFTELIHSKIVHDVPNVVAAARLQGATGDGVITADRTLVPVVTVADCMPLYLYDERTGVFGAFHSGWKGTGIIGEGIALAEKNYGARREELCVAIGAHIQRCCYVVDEARAAFFAEAFTPQAVASLHEYNAEGKRLYALSLLEANLSVLRAAGVRSCNIVAASDCTVCTQLLPHAYYPFGSFRRQAAFMPDSLSPNVRSRLMTVQAAFCGWL